MGKHSQTKLHHIKPDNRGFTMIELIVVMIIAVIFIATVIYKYTVVNTDVPNEIEILKSNIRFAQTKALNDAVDNNTWGISFTSGGTSYTYYRNGEVAYYYDKTGNKRIDNLPGECGSNRMVCISTPTHNLPSGMTITGSTVSFNQWGSPGASDIYIVLKKTGSPDVNVKVTKNTGYILIQ
jgi:prepilin-type N-terminal cleavage/methylation domain-containing protein